MDKLDYSRALACDFVRVSNYTRATRELHAKINGKHVSMVHASVKLKLSCTVLLKLKRSVLLIMYVYIIG